MRWARTNSYAAVLTIAAALALTAVEARAGIYLQRDGDGRLVLSDKPVASKAVRVTGSDANGDDFLPAVQSREDALLFQGLVRKFARKHLLSEPLVKAVIQTESSFNPEVVSPKGAVGLMQVMPPTAKSMGFDVARLKDPEINIAAGTMYLSMMLDRYRGDIQLALAAYNAGPAKVDAAGGRIPDIAETRNYVARVLDTIRGFSTEGAVYIIRVGEGRYLLTNY